MRRNSRRRYAARMRSIQRRESRGGGKASGVGLLQLDHDGARTTLSRVLGRVLTGPYYRQGVFQHVGGDPVSCAVGLAVLDVISDECLQSRARTVGDRFRDGLRTLLDRQVTRLHSRKGRLRVHTDRSSVLRVSGTESAALPPVEASNQLWAARGSPGMG